MGRIRCFLMVPLNEAALELRRYAEGDGCPGEWGYHTARVDIGERVPIGPGVIRDPAVSDEDKADPRWPSACACGYAFQPGDRWQRNVKPLYRRADTGEVMQLGDVPPGAMWFAPWYAKMGGIHPLADGVLVVRTPGGDWIVDSEASNGGKGVRGWQRTGVVPDVTATPSIMMPRYHGWLRDGWLEEC